MHRTHRNKTAAQWRTRIEECRECGLKPGEYCRLKGLSIHSFRYWANKLSDGTPRMDAPLELVRVEPPQQEAVQAVPSPSGVHLHAAGFEIRVERGFDEETLLRVLGVLGGQPGC